MVDNETPRHEVQSALARISRRSLLGTGTALVGAGVGSGLLAACGNQATANPKSIAASGANGSEDVSLSGIAANKSIGFLSLDNSAAAVAVGLQYLATMKKQLKWNVDVVDIQGDPSNVPPAVKTFVENKVDAIWAYALPGAALGTSFAPAVQAGIPIVSLASGRFAGASHLCEFDEYVSGARIGQYVAERMNYEGEIALLNFNGLQALAIRGLVMKGVLSQIPGIKIVEDIQVSVPGQTADANQKTTAILGRNPNLKAIWCGWSDVGLGVNTAVKAAGNKTVFVTSIDGVPAELDAIRNGDPLVATCVNDQALIMRSAAKVTDQILKKQTLGPTTEQDSPFVTSWNVPPANEQPSGFLTPFWKGA